MRRAKKSESKMDVRREVASWSGDILAVVLVAKPEYRPAAEAAVAYIDAAEASGGIDLGIITGALAKVPALQSKDSKLGVIGGRLILNRALGNVSLDTPETIQSAGLGLRDGLKTALDLSRV